MGSEMRKAHQKTESSPGTGIKREPVNRNGRDQKSSAAPISAGERSFVKILTDMSRMATDKAVARERKSQVMVLV